MIQTVYLSEFINAFTTYNREDNFSTDGLHALYNYMEELGDDTGEEYQLDVIALCCEFTEYENEVDCAAEYGFVADGDDLNPDVTCLEYLHDRTVVIDFDGGVIVQNC